MEISEIEKTVLLYLYEWGEAVVPIAKLNACLALEQPYLRLILRQLQHQELVDCSVVAAKIGLTLYGKTMLRIDTSVRPVTPDELAVLRSCLRGKITPEQISSKVPINCRQTLIKGLAQQKLLKIYQSTIDGVWLTRLGSGLIQEVLRP